MTVSCSVKIGWHTWDELEAAIERMGIYRVLSISPCVPDATDTQHWSQVYYEKVVP